MSGAPRTRRGPGGAGTGKTTTITHRIACQVRSGAFEPSQILAVTFTDKAAGELRARLAALGVEGVEARTFHSAALSQLSRLWPVHTGEALPVEPEYFWYFNNGVTIVCDDAEKIQKKGREVLQVQNPQVINGQQTTRVLAEAAGNPNASLLVRVIQIPRGDDTSATRFDLLVSRIVQATNWQNAIRASDLMANDRQQVAIEREFRKAGYQYLRKRQTKGEARRAAKSQFRFLVKKEELAQAVAACLLDPQVVRRGKEHLFDEAFYKTIFPDSDADSYLVKHWLLREVTRVSRGYPERAYAKWVVMHFLWSQIGEMIDARPVAFRRACEQRWKASALFSSLESAITAAFIAALQLYRKERGSGPTAIDVSAYFNRRDLHTTFEKHWAGQENRQRLRFERAIKKFQLALKEFGG
jgi:hypothetical protein